jgi:CheY-like chemotaxis protein
MTANSVPFPNQVIVGCDDDADDVDLLRLLLRKAGIECPVQFYQGGDEIISALSRFLDGSLKIMRPLLCFLDVKMPAMTGHDVLAWIRRHRPLDPVPVVMLSSSEHPEDIKRAAQAGAQCYLAKYPQPAVLREVIDEAGRFALGAPADECFRMPSNLLLVRARRV